MNQTEMTTSAPYTITRASNSWNVKVDGFWSSSMISIYSRYNLEDKTVSLSMSVSSGGRDEKVIKSDIEAYRNYGLAIIAATDFMRDLDLVALAAEYQADIDEGMKQYAAERAAVQAAKDADPVDSYEKMSAAVRALRGQVGASVTFKSVAWARCKLTVVVTHTQNGWTLATTHAGFDTEWTDVEHCANLAKINNYLQKATTLKLV